jgi:hypothetical protein
MLVCALYVIEGKAFRHFNLEGAIDQSTEGIRRAPPDRGSVIEVIGEARPRQKERSRLAQFGWGAGTSRYCNTSGPP